MLLEFDKQEVVAELGLGEGGGIRSKMLVNEPEDSVVGTARAIGVVTQRQEVSELVHRRVGMIVVDGVLIVARCGSDRGWSCGFGAGLAGRRCGALCLAEVLLVKVGIAGG
jgi:hypothetical protein